MNSRKEKYGDFRIKKAFGQNFLKNVGLCAKIVEAAKLNGVNVLEIGPGFGALTKELLKKAAKVFAIEKDEELMPYLEETFSKNDNLKLINVDFLELNLEEFVKKNNIKDNLHICANLPYYITTPLVVKILTSKVKIQSATLMMQKEVANRLAKKPGEKGCGSISVFVHYYSEPKILMDVSKGNFFPIPKVDSAVIRLEKRDEKVYDVENEDVFFKMVRLAFSQKRKMMINPLSKGFKLKKEVVADLLKKNNLKLNVRAQEVNMQQFVNLSNSMNNFISKPLC